VSDRRTFKGVTHPHPIALTEDIQMTNTQDNQVSEAADTEAVQADVPAVDEAAVRARVAAISELLVQRELDPAAFEATLAAEREAHEAYLAAAPGTPLADALRGLGVTVAGTVSAGNGGSGSRMDVDHAEAWLKDYVADKSHKRTKWHLIQTYRGQGHKANDDQFFALVKDVVG
jgi:hypothetical protein